MTKLFAKVLFSVLVVVAPPALANDNFQQATHKCLITIIHEVPFEQTFRHYEIVDGAGDGEYEILGYGHHIFLDTGLRSCSIMNSDVTTAEANMLLPDILRTARIHDARTEEGYGGQTVIRGSFGNKPLEIYVNTGHEGGAAYIMSVGANQ